VVFKTLETIWIKQNLDRLEELSQPEQHAYKRKHNCGTALLDLHNHIDDVMIIQDLIRESADTHPNVIRDTTGDTVVDPPSHNNVTSLKSDPNNVTNQTPATPNSISNDERSPSYDNRALVYFFDIKSAFASGNRRRLFHDLCCKFPGDKFVTKLRNCYNNLKMQVQLSFAGVGDVEVD
jgi:uncharacterized protein (UPF0305 family)